VCFISEVDETSSRRESFVSRAIRTDLKEKDGVRLRARLPAYLAQRRALLDAHCPLLPPLQDLVHGYEEPTTTDEIWATGLGEPL
jgi:hypothetical protein